ncbi:MAG: hypothetical protein PVI86_20180, partial [Phycisphaerae bacterium]
MLGVASIANRTLSQTLTRAFWASMGIVHASALFSAWRSFLAGGEEASSLAGCLALSLSMVYFVLKVCGVTFLPFKPGRRGWVAAGLLVVMIHAD